MADWLHSWMNTSGLENTSGATRSSRYHSAARRVNMPSRSAFWMQADWRLASGSQQRTEKPRVFPLVRRIGAFETRGNNTRHSGVEVLTTMVMKSTIFWDITQCRQLNVFRRFGGTYRLHLQSRKNKLSKKLGLLATRFHASFLLS
jgi:hypothetical protein